MTKQLNFFNVKAAKSPFKRLMVFVRNIFFLFIIVSISSVILARFIPIYVTPLMMIRTVESIFDGKMPKNKKEWVPIEDISPNMVNAVVASEDNLFLTHYGFSFSDIGKAFKHNKKGKKMRGGSTITQQTAKNVFLWPDRSYIRKGLEAYYTVLIELFWSKERIMEVYLNVIETGKGIYGVEAASQKYFGKSADRLTKSQAALIAACLPNPRRFNAGYPSGYISRRKSQIVYLMRRIGPVDFDKNNKPKKHSRKHKN